MLVSVVRMRVPRPLGRSRDVPCTAAPTHTAESLRRKKGGQEGEEKMIRGWEGTICTYYAYHTTSFLFFFSAYLKGLVIIMRNVCDVLNSSENLLHMRHLINKMYNV